jgi:hypothetical protein
MQKACISPSKQQLLDQLIERGILGNGYLFHGQTGSFLSEAANYVIWRALGSSQNNPDIIQINPHPKRITLEFIREIQDRVKYGPSHHSRMIVVIHRAESMTPEAANAFLKTLEEADQKVTFILLTLQHHTILPTIKSRCQHLYFPPLTESDLRNSLEDNQGLWDQCHGKLDFVLDYLENQTTPPEQYISSTEVKQMSLSDKLRLAESLSKDKEALGKTVLCWIRESLAHPTLETSHELSAMVTLIRRLSVPLNLRLHVESLLLTIHNSRLVQSRNLS